MTGLDSAEIRRYRLLFLEFLKVLTKIPPFSWIVFINIFECDIERLFPVNWLISLQLWHKSKFKKKLISIFHLYQTRLLQPRFIKIIFNWIHIQPEPEIELQTNQLVFVGIATAAVTDQWAVRHTVIKIVQNKRSLASKTNCSVTHWAKCTFALHTLRFVVGREQFSRWTWYTLLLSVVPFVSTNALVDVKYFEVIDFEVLIGSTHSHPHWELCVGRKGSI